MTRTKLLALGAAVLGAAGIGAVGVSVATATPPDAIQAAKSVSARYHSIAQAEAAGYTLGPLCTASPAGGMGFHYANAELMADDTLDPLRPEILVYAPKANGKLELVAIEYWKRDADGQLSTSGDRPSLLGRPFDGPMPGHSPDMPVHYDLHVWLYESNANGLFAQWNPSVSCG